jgi:hypothetical protein
MPSNAEIESAVIAEIGAKYANFLKGKYVSSRLCGMLTARGRNHEWEKALEHISLHFSRDSTKETHTVFAKKYRDPDVLKDLINSAAMHPSTIRLSRLTINNQPIGKVCAILIREFRQPIGTQSDEFCLFVVVDQEAKLITAYPKNKKDAGLP